MPITTRTSLPLAALSLLLAACTATPTQPPAAVVEPAAQTTLKGSLRDTLGTFSTLVLGGLACLIIPIFGGPMLFLLASYLNVRSLVNDALDGITNDAERRQIIKTNRKRMLLLGVMLSVLMLIPFFGFFAPVLMGASVVHLCLRAHKRLLSSTAPHPSKEFQCI